MSTGSSHKPAETVLRTHTIRAFAESPTASQPSLSLRLHEAPVAVGAPLGLASKAWPAAAVLADFFLHRSAASPPRADEDDHTDPLAFLRVPQPAINVVNHGDYDGGGDGEDSWRIRRQRRPRRRRVRVLELGSGTGLCGLALAAVLAQRGARGVDVLLTDLPAVVPLLAANIAANASEDDGGVRVYARALAWGDADQHAALEAEFGSDGGEGGSSDDDGGSGGGGGGGGGFDLVLLADLVYFPELFGPLLSTLRRLTSGRSSRPALLLASKQRELAKELPFFELLADGAGDDSHGGPGLGLEPVAPGVWPAFWDCYRARGFVVGWLVAPPAGARLEELLLSWVGLEGEDNEDEEDVEDDERGGAAGDRRTTADTTARVAAAAWVVDGEPVPENHAAYLPAH
ncbi:hypothetical protein HK405_005172 [Cladochytrium tenue]|nr:hypothetical protein HK405_005172 [Cladochytrium tenue]